MSWPGLTRRERLKRWLRPKPKPFTIQGLEILNCGTGLSVDDIVTDDAMVRRENRSCAIPWHAPKLPWYTRLWNWVIRKKPPELNITIDPTPVTYVSKNIKPWFGEPKIHGQEILRHKDKP